VDLLSVDAGFINQRVQATALSALIPDPFYQTCLFINL